MRWESESVHQPGIHRGHGYPGHADEDQRVHVGDRQLGGVEGRPDRPLADLLGHPDPGVVGLAPVFEFVVGVDREGEVASADQHPPVKRLQPGPAPAAAVPIAAQRSEQRFLVVVVVREGFADRRDFHRPSMPSGPGSDNFRRECNLPAPRSVLWGESRSDRVTG